MVQVDLQPYTFNPCLTQAAALREERAAAARAAAAAVVRDGVGGGRGHNTVYRAYMITTPILGSFEVAHSKIIQGI